MSKAIPFSLEDYIHSRMGETLIDFTEVEKLVGERTDLASSYAVEKALSSLVRSGRVKMLKKRFPRFGYKRFYQRGIGE